MSPDSDLTLAGRIGRSFMVLLVGRLVTVLATLTFLAIVTRSLGAEGYGQFRTAQAWLSFIYLLANLGLPEVLLREMGAAGSDAPRVLAAALGLRLISALALFLLAAAVSPLFPWEPVVALAIVAGVAGFIALSLFDTLIAVFRAHLQQGGQLRAELTAALALLAGGGLVGWHKGGVVAFSSVFSLALILQLAVAWRHASLLVPLRIGCDQDHWRSLLRSALPLAVANLLVLVYYRADTLLLALLRPAAEVGIYGIASRLLDTAVGVAILLTSLLAPRLAARRSEPQAFAQLFASSIDSFLIGGGAIVLTLAAFGGELAALIGGAEFYAARLPTAVLALTFLCASLSLLLRQALIALDRHHGLLPGYGFAALLALSVNLLLIPILGATGAALSTLAGEACVLMWTARTLARLGALPNRRRSLFVMLAALFIGGLGGLALRAFLPWLFALPGAMAMYFAALAVGGLIARPHLANLLRALRGPA